MTNFFFFFPEHFLSLNLLLTSTLSLFLKPEYLFINCEDIISGFRKHSKESKNNYLTSDSYTLYFWSFHVLPVFGVGYKVQDIP